MYISQKSCIFAAELEYSDNSKIVERMRKITNIIAILMATVICNSAFAATSTLTFTAKCNGSGTADDGVTWTVSSDGLESSFVSGKGIQYVNKSSTKYLNYIRLTTSGITGTVTQVKVNACGNPSNLAHVEVSVGGTSLKWDGNTQAPLVSSPYDFIFTGSASGTIQVRIIQNPATSSLYCKSIEVTYTADMVVSDGQTKTISAVQSVENLTIEDGGIVVLSDKKLTVDGDFVLKTTMGSGKSGQLTGATNSNFEVKGNSYIDITLGDNGNAAKWHAFTVPFPVDALHGIYDTNGNQLTNGTHYAIMDYHGDIRANGQYGWKKFTGTMTPGTFYLMTVDGNRTTYRMKATGDLFPTTSKDFFEYSGTGDATDHGWNGLGNPTLQYSKVNYPVQVLDPTNYVFETKPANSCNFVVGTPFFYQASADGSMSMLTADAAASYAPKRINTTEPLQATIVFGNEDYTDYLYLSASDDASDSYEIGKDLAKMVMTAQPTVAQIVGVAYGTSLSMVHAPLLDHQAYYTISLYAPVNGTYRIAVQEIIDAEVYITKDGVVLADITTHDTQLELTKGENNQYGLILSTKDPSTTTKTENVSGTLKVAQKIIINNQLFILRDGKLYDSTGKIVRK